MIWGSIWCHKLVFSKHENYTESLRIAFNNLHHARKFSVRYSPYIANSHQQATVIEDRILTMGLDCQAIFTLGFYITTSCPYSAWWRPGWPETVSHFQCNLILSHDSVTISPMSCQSSPSQASIMCGLFSQVLKNCLYWTIYCLPA